LLFAVLFGLQVDIGVAEGKVLSGGDLDVDRRVPGEVDALAEVEEQGGQVLTGIEVVAAFLGSGEQLAQLPQEHGLGGVQAPDQVAVEGRLGVRSAVCLAHAEVAGRGREGVARLTADGDGIADDLLGHQRRSGHVQHDHLVVWGVRQGVDAVFEGVQEGVASADHGDRLVERVLGQHRVDVVQVIAMR